MKAINDCQNLQDFKDLVALRYQWEDFKDFYDTYKTIKDGQRFIMEMVEEAAELYATTKVERALKSK